MKLEKNDVEHVGELVRIKLTEEEKEKFTDNMGDILGHVEELDSAPTEKVLEITQISDLENIARKDEIKPSLPNEKVLQNAPDKHEGFIKVKQVFE
jgi:aspartyl-tRNA(Asn)/glutamyl-tRNA(Gln) amidotransferase subunit C